MTLHTGQSIVGAFVGLEDRIAIDKVSRMRYPGELHNHVR